MRCNTAKDTIAPQSLSPPISSVEDGGGHLLSVVHPVNDDASADDRQGRMRSEAKQRPPEADGGAAPLLEQEGKHCTRPVEQTESRHEIVHRRCKHWYCPSCCTSKGIKLERRLTPILETFEGIQMWTLTIDPSLFDSPRDAFDHIRTKHSIGKLVAALDKRNRLYSRRYFCAVEFHKSGMVHYHLLLDTGGISHKLVTELWGRNRPKDAEPVGQGRPPFGFVFYSKMEFKSAKGAAGYACKYLTKVPKEGYPDWVLDYPGQPRRYSASQGFWPSDRKPTPKSEDHDSNAANASEVERSVPQPKRTVRECLAECRKSCVLLHAEPVEQEDGTIQWMRRFVADIPATLDNVAAKLRKPYTGNRLLLYPRDLEKLVELEKFLNEAIRKPLNEPERNQAIDDHNARRLE